MVFHSPLSNLRGFVSARPPLVVFTISLMAFAVTTLSLAYYVEHNSNILNTDAQADWTSFLKYLSDLELCLSPSDGPSVTNMSHNDMDYVTNVTVTISASLKLSSLMPHNITHIQGMLPIIGWKSRCATDIPQGIAVSFNITGSSSTNNNNNNHSEMQDICVSFTGPRSLLPPSASASEGVCSAGASALVGAWGKVSGRTTASLGEQIDFCNDGYIARLSYGAASQRPLNLLLTVRDRSMINLHLVHTSYFLLVMAVTLICYAIIKGKPKTSKMQSIIEKVPLDP